ncbi:MAG: SAM-dependent methyltransferase [Candidatus Hydrothermarchaeota archaeon]
MIVATVISGFEKEAIEELEEITKDEVKTTYFKGLLLIKSKNPREKIKKIKESDTKFLVRAIPIDYVLNIYPGKVNRWFDDLARKSSGLIDKSFMVRCRRRGSHSFKSEDVEREVGKRIKDITGARVDLLEPNSIVFVEIIQNKAYVSVCKEEEIFYKKGRKIKRHGERPLNRAMLKLEEVFELHRDWIPKERVLDIGASPGGWTKVLSRYAKEVIAVDSAPLEPSVAKLPNVRFLQKRAEDLSLDEVGELDMVTNDVNLLHKESAALTLKFRRCLVDGGKIIHTTKLAIVPGTNKFPVENIDVAVKEVSEMFTKNGLKVEHVLFLKSNTRNERTILAKKECL